MRALRYAAALAFALWFVFALARPIQSLDVGWHLASGRWMAETHQIPSYDVFSFTCAGHPWIDTYWFFDLLFYGIFTLAGLSGIIFAKGLLVLALLWIAERRMAQAQVPVVGRLLGMAIIFAGAHPRRFGWPEQASMITVLFLSMEFWWLEEAWAELPFNRFWRWPLFFALWANLHRGFLLGLIFLGVYLLQATLQRRMSWRSAFGRWMLCAAAATLNPYGAHLYLHLWHDWNESPGAIAGWALTPWMDVELFWCLLAAFWLAVFAGLRREIKPAPLLCAALLSLLGIRYVFSFPYFVLFSVPLLAVWFFQLRPVQRTFTPGGRSEISALLTLLVLFGGAAAQAKPAGGFNARIFPMAAANFFDQEISAARLYNEYRFGGFLMWRNFGRRPVFIDGRYSAVQGYPALFEADRRARAQDPAQWESFLGHYGVDSALLEYPNSTRQLPSPFSLYFPEQRWALVYWDDVCMLYLKRSRLNARAIDRWEFRSVKPDMAPAFFADFYRTAPPARRAEIMKELEAELMQHPQCLRALRLRAAVANLSL